MALTGQLSDMSLAELIEFFCNQRKTGRLKIDYARGHSVFFIKDGELVDARVGSLNGVDAVYFSLTLPNAAFDFSPEVLPTRQSIRESWTQVVLEGLRRLDEGIAPTEADAFGSWSPSESDVAQVMDQIDRLAEAASDEAPQKEAPAPVSHQQEAPLSMMVESAGGMGGSGRKWVVMGVAAALALACAFIAVPLARRTGSNAVKSTPVAPAPATRAGADASAPAASAMTEAPAVEDATASTEQNSTDAREADAALALRREREVRERETREREARERERREREAREQARKAGETETPAEKLSPAPAAATGPKTVRVSVSYDEEGRVTQASVAGTSPGAEAYGATALRIARGRRFPAGKAGATVVTIPIN